MAKVPRTITTVAQVIEALGAGDKAAGRRELIHLTGRSTQHCTNWLAEGRLPKNFWLILSRALEKRGFRVKPELFGITPLKKAS